MQTFQPHTLPELPFALEDLQPHISAQTLSFHHAKHHATYVNNLNNLLKDHPLAGKSLEEIIIASHKDASQMGIFNNAAQVWNHTFFWHCLKKNGGGMPGAKLLEKINKSFTSFDKFKEEFKAAGLAQFGSGWVWLVLEHDELKITKTPNADLPMAHKQKAIITCDVWEHAYYLDYQNRRADFLTVFLEKLVNWQFGEANLSN
jgi:Fe-Mn family superoxide dismutase